MSSAMNANGLAVILRPYPKRRHNYFLPTDAKTFQEWLKALKYVSHYDAREIAHTIHFASVPCLGPETEGRMESGMIAFRGHSAPKEKRRPRKGARRAEFWSTTSGGRPGAQSMAGGPLVP